MTADTYLAFKLRLVILPIALFISLYGSAQKEIPSDYCMSTDEVTLFNKLNQLIDEYGKTELELSASLSYVASTHVDDLLNNKPDTSVCNLSSWSDKGDWTACCHNPYVPQQDCMWDKPKELTTYPYRGYELVSFFEDGFNTDSVMQLWTASKQVLDMILTEGNFKKKKWICMGVGMNKNYVSVWFGQRSDKVKEPEICSDSTTALSEEVLSDNELKFYIIFGSYSNPREAREALKNLNKEGFKNANILKTGDNIRVYLDSFSNIKEAMHYKQKLGYAYRESWIFKE